MTRLGLWFKCKALHAGQRKTTLKLAQVGIVIISLKEEKKWFSRLYCTHDGVAGALPLA